MRRPDAAVDRRDATCAVVGRCAGPALCGRSGRTLAATGVGRVGALAALLFGLSGCAAPRAAAPMTADARVGNAALVEYVADSPYVTAEAAYRMAYLLRHDALFDGEFAALRDELVEAGIVRRRWGHAAEQYINRATAAVLICESLRWPGGVNWRLTGLGRYAWRDLQYRNVAGSGADWGLVRGGEFLGMIQRAEEQLRARGSGGPATDGSSAIELGPQPGAERR
ncbi:MAG: hypothetical protein IPM64_14310 [Phycisphaerales bacterium]|nr:hypothetical protein [Phycisphaerales bacterium]